MATKEERPITVRATQPVVCGALQASWNAAATIISYGCWCFCCPVLSWPTMRVDRVKGDAGISTRAIAKAVVVLASFCQCLLLLLLMLLMLLLLLLLSLLRLPLLLLPHLA